MEKFYYSYNQCLKDCKILLPKIKRYNPDALVAIARGGLTLGHLLSQAMETNKLYTINSVHYEKEQKLNTFEISNIPNLEKCKRVVLIDDIIDSGETIQEVKKILEKRYLYCEFKIATIFYKKDAIMQPDFTVKEAHSWIDFFWEVDLK